MFHALATTRSDVAPGPDGITGVMLRGTAVSIAPHITTIFNASLRLGKVPTVWKNSNITPIFKSGDSSLVSNYRPISLLSPFSKCLERQVFNKILHHVLEYGLLSDSQFAFRPGASTQEAVLASIRDWHWSLEKGESVACVFFDLSKAFDSLPHSLILDSLHRVGVTGDLLRWVRDYLSDRTQQVVIRGSLSSTINITSGVPQGSILGPVLFIIAIDSVACVSISLLGRLRIYADDICYYRPVSSSVDLSVVQNDVDLVCQWARETNLRLNVGKTKCMLISRKRDPPVLSLDIDGTEISQVKSIKHLGFIISDDLCWAYHITTICGKAKRFIRFLYRYFHQADRPCLAKSKMG